MPIVKLTFFDTDDDVQNDDQYSKHKSHKNGVNYTFQYNQAGLSSLFTIKPSREWDVILDGCARSRLFFCVFRYLMLCNMCKQDVMQFNAVRLV